MKCHPSRELEQLALDRSVADAVSFFRSVDPELSDGSQTAREVLSHLVFWHCAYVGTAWALATRRAPPLFQGKFRELNAFAAQKFKNDSMQTLCAMLLHRQTQLKRALNHLDDWSVDFPAKEECAPAPVAQRLHDMEAHIRGHVTRLKRAAHEYERALATEA